MSTLHVDTVGSARTRAQKRKVEQVRRCTSERLFRPHL